MAVSEVGVESVRVSLVVVYVRRKDSVIRVVTVYPLGKVDRKVGFGRWVRVK